MNNTSKNPGIFYLIGPEGSGKESLMRYCRHALASRTDVIFAHRYITCHPDHMDENYIYLSEKEFSQRVHNNLMAMAWSKQDHRYGIGTEIDMWLNKGLSVVVNGSRSYLGKAKQKYPGLVPVLLSVSGENISRRLNVNDADKQLHLAEIVNDFYKFRECRDHDLHVIDNNSTLQQAGSQLVDIINQYREISDRQAS